MIMKQILLLSFLLWCGFADPVIETTTSSSVPATTLSSSLETLEDEFAPPQDNSTVDQPTPKILTPTEALQVLDEVEQKLNNLLQNREYYQVFQSLWELLEDAFKKYLTRIREFQTYFRNGVEINEVEVSVQNQTDIVELERKVYDFTVDVRRLCKSHRHIEGFQGPPHDFRGGHHPHHHQFRRPHHFRR